MYTIYQTVTLCQRPQYIISVTVIIIIVSMANLHILKKELWQGLLLSLMNVLKGEHTALHKKHTLQKLPRVLQQLSNLSASTHSIVQYFSQASLNAQILCKT